MNKIPDSPAADRPGRIRRRDRPHFGLCPALALGWAIVLSSLPCLGQTRPASRRPVAQLARYAPQESKVFVAARSLDDLLKGLHRANADSALDALPTSDDAETGPARLRRFVTAFAGLEDPSHIADMNRCELAWIAPSWTKLGDSVLLLRVAEQSPLESWYPPRRRRGSGELFGATFFHVDDGLLICSRDRFVAMARRWGPNSLFELTMRLLADSPQPGAPALADLRPFHELVAYLPTDPLALIYLATDVERTARPPSPSPWFPRLDRAALGVYEGRGRLELALRGHVQTPHRKAVLAPKAHDRLLLLPHDSLLAVASTVDLRHAYASATADGKPMGLLGGYLTRLLRPHPRDGTGPAPMDLLGPHVLTVWAQGVGETGTTPQLAVLMEAGDQDAALELADRIARSLLDVVWTLDGRPADRGLAVREGRYLGEVVRSVSLGDYADRTRIPLLKLARNLEPAWAVSRGWLIIALNRPQLESILDAQTGLVPTLGVVPDVRAAIRKAGDRTVVALAQPDLATGLLQKWLDARRSGTASLLDPEWWSLAGFPSSADGGMAGLKLQEVPQLGAVVVDEVASHGRFHGKLRTDDLIVGIDGRLLPLTKPLEPLESRLRSPTDGAAVTLRVHRGDAALDVTLPPIRSPTPPLPFEPTDVLAELIVIGRALQFASFESTTSDEEHYSARISLRFTPPIGAADAATR